MKLRAYKKLRHVTSAWLDAIPDDWQWKRLKRVVSLVNEKADSGDGTYVGLENVESWTGRYIETTGEMADSAANRFAETDVLFGKLRPYLAKALAPGFRGRCTGELLVLRPRELDRRFLHYYCLSDAFVRIVDSSTYGAKMPRADWEFIGRMGVPFPASRDEQTLIADFLDRETARVDGMIGKKEELLRLLEEKRASLISHTVARGLDPAAKLKDSRISWLGKIPVHWEVWRLGHLAVIGNGSTPNRDNRDYWSGGKHPWLNSSVVNDDLVTQAPDFVTDVALRECHLPSVARGSVLVALTGEGKTRGKAAVLNFTATINQHIAYITPRPSLMESTYLQRLLTKGYDALRVLSDGAGSTKGAVTCEQLRNLRIVVPPLTEQHSIISYLNDKLSSIDRLKGTLRESMQFLREHRNALISAAVTGKIDVRNA